MGYCIEQTKDRIFCSPAFTLQSTSTKKRKPSRKFHSDNSRRKKLLLKGRHVKNRMSDFEEQATVHKSKAPSLFGKKTYEMDLGTSKTTGKESLTDVAHREGTQPKAGVGRGRVEAEQRVSRGQGSGREVKNPRKRKNRSLEGLCLGQ